MDILGYIVTVLLFGILGGSIILSAVALYDIRESINTIKKYLLEDKTHD